MKYSIDTQRSLIYCGMEDASASELLSDIGGGRYGESRDAWQQEVAIFLSKAIENNLLEIKDDFGFFPDLSAEGIKLRYFTSFLSEDILWMGVQFSATEKLREILSSEGLLNWDAMKNASVNFNLKAAFEG